MTWTRSMEYIFFKLRVAFKAACSEQMLLKANDSWGTPSPLLPLHTYFNTFRKKFPKNRSTEKIPGDLQSRKNSTHPALKSHGNVKPKENFKVAFSKPQETLVEQI